MNEATKLSPDTPVTREPELGLDAAADVAAVDVAAAPRTAHAVTLPAKRSFARRAANTTLVLFLIGLLAFAAGAVVAWAITSGMLDTPWVKDLMHSLKDLVKHSKTTP